MRVLVSHQCGPGFKSRRRNHIWVDFLLVLSRPPRGFAPGTPVFPSPQKLTLQSKFQFDLERTDTF